MAEDTLVNLQTRVNAAKNETAPGKNTKIRVFQLLLDILDTLKSWLSKWQWDIDANGKRITNLTTPVGATEPVRKGEFDNHFAILNQFVKNYNPLYNLKGFCIAGQAAPVATANDVYYYTGSVNGTVFGIPGVTKDSYMVYTTLWTNIIIDSFAKKTDLFAIENKSMITLPTTIYGDGVANGAIATTNGFVIPVGSTGNGSYRRFRKNIIDVSSYFIGQVLKFTFTISIDNFEKLSSQNIFVKIQRQVGITFNSTIDGDFISSVDSVYGITLTKKCTINHVITQLDITNGYNFVCIAQVNNLTVVTTPVTVTLSEMMVMEGVNFLGKITGNENNISDHTLRITKIENEVVKSDNIPAIFVNDGTGNNNGASDLANGYSIPIGSTGNTSYRLIKPASLAFDSSAYLGQCITFTVPVTYTNFAQLSNIKTSLSLRSMKGSVIIQSGVTIDSYSYTDVINGTTLIRTYVVNHIVTQSDLTNNYWYCVYFQLNNINVVSLVVTITTTEFSISQTKSIQNLLSKHESRITVLEGAVPTVITAKRTGTSGVDADFCGRRAIQDAIDSVSTSSKSNQFIIKASGIFEALTPANFDKGDQVGSGQKHFIEGKNFVHLQGSGKDECVIIGRLADNLGVSFGYSLYNVVMWNCNSNIENLTVIGENVRYSVHIDGGQLACKDFTQNLRVLRIYNKNTGDATNWYSRRAIVN